MAKQRSTTIKAQGDTAEILIYEEIGEGWFGGLGSKAFREQLNALDAAVTTINVRINSPGGSVFEGIAIYQALKEHKATVNVYVDALAASIASVIAMAGDKVYIASMAMMMIHEAWCFTMGNAGELRATADLLQKIDGQIRIAYGRSSMTEEELVAAMAAETWLSGQEAVDKGFADALSDPKEEDDEELAAAALYNLTKFDKMPAAFAAAVVGAQNKVAERSKTLKNSEKPDEKRIPVSILAKRLQLDMNQ